MDTWSAAVALHLDNRHELLLCGAHLHSSTKEFYIINDTDHIQACTLDGNSIPDPQKDPHVKRIMRSNELHDCGGSRATEGLAFVVSQASFMLSLLFSFYSLEKSRWMPYIGPCACWLWHGTWTCFLTRSKDRGTMRETCLHASATAWEGFGAYWIQLPLSFQFLIIISKSKAILQLLVLCSKNKENWACPLEPPGKR